MEYHEATNFLFDLQRFGPRPGTESVGDLLAHLDDPHDGVACVQIAGSNGKGSTARMTERVLREAGISVGLYTSPQIEQFRDRIRVDGRLIPEAEVARFVDRTREYITDKAAEGIAPTFFETSTALALWHFAREDVDVAVLEVGIGGSKDATSVVDPIASAVTTVTMEHADVLGDTIAEIATDKAHVAPADRPIVTAATDEALTAINAKAGETLTVGPTADRDVQTQYHGKVDHAEAKISLTGGAWSVTTRIPLIGAHQAENAGIAAALATHVTDELGVPLETETLQRGLRQAHWPGRCEVMNTAPTVILDGAHNAGACRRLAETLEEFDYEQLHVVAGIMHDKRHAEMAAALPTADRLIACQPPLDRAANPEVLRRVFETAGTDPEAISIIKPVEDAVATAIAAADAEDCVLVTGSLFTVREARARWSRTQTPRRIETVTEAEQAFEMAGVPADRHAEVAPAADHHVIETRLTQQQANRIENLLVREGGECAISGVEHDGERRRVLMMGTTGEFAGLCEALTAEPGGLATIAAEIADQVGLDYPAEQDQRPITVSAARAAPARRDQSENPEYPWLDGTAIMGILNITPDSFHDGGEYNRRDAARDRAQEMIEAGVEVLDVGGESTRPGADPVTIQEEIDRVTPVIEAIADLDAMISVDTRKAPVAEAALEAGADIINDVSGLEDPALRFVAAEHDAPLVVMHSIETPVDPDTNVEYDDVVRDVIEDLRGRVQLARQAGLSDDQILVDPGVGFGKTPAESFELLDRLGELEALGCPIMIGHSHKSMFGLAGYEHGDRLAPTIAATALAADRGADLIRVHDPQENVAAVRTVETAASAGHTNDSHE